MTGDLHESLAECRSYLKKRLDGCFTRADDLTKRFATNGTTREILDQRTLFHLLKLILYSANHHISAADENLLQSLVGKIRGLETTTSPGYCNILATLLYIRCTDGCLKSWAQGLSHDMDPQDQYRPIHDADLPLIKAAALDKFGHDDGQSFWEQQYLFCAVTLKEFDESVYVDHKASCRLPFGEERFKIGKGNFATVYKVKIEKGHMVNESSGLALQNSKWYAQKEFIDYDAATKRTFEAEGSTIKQFIQATKIHENILVTKASLEWGDTYSLFFDLAKYSLWDYFQDPNISITTLEQKKKVFGHTIGLAGALAYLHDELFIASTGEQLCCYHLDLKPHNILVFEERDNVIWKVSDFGISQIKRIPASRANFEPEHRISFLNSIFRPDKSGADPSSGVANPRDAGTCTAPEARHKTGKVTRNSDVWSLGCVLASVLTFLDNQRTGIRDFEVARMKDRDDDLFYDSFPTRFGAEPRPSLRPSISIWLDHLTENARKRGENEGKAVELASELVRSQMLLPEPAERSPARRVEKQLRFIQYYFVVASTPAPAQRQPWQPMIERLIANLSHFIHFRNMLSSRRSISPKKSETWHFKLPESTKGCRFNHDGRYLGIYSGSRITTLDTSTLKIQQETGGVTQTTTKSPERWSDYSLGSRYLCAAIESSYFKCHYSPLSSTSTLPKIFIDPGVKSRICKVVLSPDDKTTAFILEETRQREQILKIAVYHTRDMMSFGPAQGEPRSITNGSSSASRPSTAGLLTGGLPWNNIIANPTDCELPNASHIHHLKFSDNGKILMGITKPYRWDLTQEYHYGIFIWDMAYGRKIFSCTNKNKGFYDMESSWRISSIALFANHHSYAEVSSKEIKIVSYEAGRYEARSKSTCDQILDVVARKEGDELVLVGRSNSRGRIKAFRLPKDQVDGFGSVGRGIETGMGDYNPMTDCCCLYKEAGYGKQGLLIARIKGRKCEGKLSFCYLE